ncbi:MAG: hypothetical protein Q8904_15505 [Bacteroidota bacterium]|nr:hypothetical protein [Bacteroidota bacterium]
MRIRVLFISALLLSLPGAGRADSPDKLEDLFQHEIKLKLNESGSASTKLSFSTQFWGRYTGLNAGSTNKAGDPLTSENEFALRRTRFIMTNNLDDRIIFYTQLGFNNLNSTSSKPQLFFHDVWGMFRVVPKSFYIGFGLNGWNGLSRLSNTSSIKTMTLDNPGVNYPNINRTDLEGRQLGIFAKGTAGRVSYRTAIVKPFVYNGLTAQPQANTGYEYPSENLEYKGYIAYHFLDKEYFTTPYMDMTYLGAKKICNLGAGFDIYPQSIAEYDASHNRNLKDRNLFAVDFMFELPMKDNQTVTVYSALYGYDFGSNFLKSSGVMNNWNGGTGIEGAGNNEFKIGTGNIFYSTLGYLFPKQFLQLPGRLQLFYAFTDKNFKALHPVLFNHDCGANYYVAGQKLKFSFQYSLRPILDQSAEHIASYKSTAIFQIQLMI